MPHTDRAFRALAREQPQTIAALLQLVAPHLVRPGAVLAPEHVGDPHLDPPPTIEADWVARDGEAALVHLEGQGYADPGFLDRLFRYHLALVLRYPDRQVCSVALWLRRPPRGQRADRIVRQGVEVRVSSVVLGEVAAELLLGRRETACFAAGAHAGRWTDGELCRRVVGVLAEGSTERERMLAVVLALVAGRYDAMIEAMREAELETPIIEDLVRFGEDRGKQQGLQQGREDGRAEGLEVARRALVRILEARGLAPTAEQCGRIGAEQSLEQVAAWIERAATAGRVDEVLAR